MVASSKFDTLYHPAIPKSQNKQMLVRLEALVSGSGRVPVARARVYLNNLQWIPGRQAASVE